MTFPGGEKLRGILQRYAPEPVVRFFARQGQLQPDLTARKDLTVLHAQPDLRIEVFWKNLPNGKGPAASLFVLDREVLRFDCFGKTDGHFHAALTRPSSVRQHRIHFCEQTAAAQIERTCFEIRHNLGFYLERNPERAIRRVKLDAESVSNAARMACDKMMVFLNMVPELADLRDGTAIPCGGAD